MAYFTTATAPERRNPTEKNRVWDFFPLSSRTRPANRRQSPQPRRKLRPTATKSALGIPYWPSRDPIGEKGGMNLYGFVRNDGVDKVDINGLDDMGGIISGFGGGTNWVPGNLEYYTPPPANTVSLPDLTLSFKKSFSVEGCSPTGIPGVVVCLRGQVSIKVGKCCDGKTPGRMAEASGQITAGAGVGTGGWTVSDDIAGGEFDFGMPPCPKETKPEVKGVIDISANAGPGSVGCSYTFPGGSWSCGGSLAASASTGGANASIQGGINVSGKYKQ